MESAKVRVQINFFYVLYICKRIRLCTIFFIFMILCFKKKIPHGQGRECLLREYFPLIKMNWLGIPKWKPMDLLRCTYSVWMYGHTRMISLAFIYFYLYSVELIICREYWCVPWRAR